MQAYWFDLPNLPNIQAKFIELGMDPFEVAFKRKCGMSPKEYFLLLLGIYTYFLGKSDKPSVLVDDTYFGSSFDSENIRKVMTDISLSPDQLAVNLLSTPRQNWATDCTPLRKYPLIEVLPGRHACADLGILYRCLTDKIYFHLQESYPGNQFGQLFGYIFQEYIFNLIRSFTYEGSILERTFYANPRFEGTNDEAGDGLVLMDDIAFVMEFKARLLTTREKHGGIKEVTLRGIDDILAKDKSKSKKGVVQLANTLPRLINGQAICSGPGKVLDLSGYRQIIPLVVTNEEALGFELSASSSRRNCKNPCSGKENASTRSGRCWYFPFGRWSCSKALSSRHRPMQMLLDYTDYVRHNPKDRAGSFNSFVHNRGLFTDASSGPPIRRRINNVRTSSRWLSWKGENEAKDL